MIYTKLLLKKFYYNNKIFTIIKNIMSPHAKIIKAKTHESPFLTQKNTIMKIKSSKLKLFVYV